MIDFNEGKEVLNRFLGSEKKTTVLYNGTVYMLKFPDPVRESCNSLSYMNNQFSEHIGCRIFQACGLEAQKTVLGTYTDKKGQRKIVVGCEDFTQHGASLHEFSKLQNSVVEDDAKPSLSIESVLKIIDENELILDKETVRQCFWDMFVVDALIGNGDRHLDNFGLLSEGDTVRFAPIYDCGSSLGALLSDEDMKRLQDNAVGMKSTEYNLKSCFTYQGKRIFYHEIFRNPPPALKRALGRMIPRIDENQLFDIVRNVEGMSAARKEYLCKALQMRYTEILCPAYKKVQRESRQSER